MILRTKYLGHGWRDLIFLGGLSVMELCGDSMWRSLFYCENDIPLIKKEL